LFYGQPMRRLFPDRRSIREIASAVGLLSLLAMGLSACGAASLTTPPGVIRAVAAENQYGNVISQIGGRYVEVFSVLHNPNADPHSFEASTQVAQEIGQASLVVQNGLGYDSFMDNIESASPSSSRHVIVVQHVIAAPPSTTNPHFWYDLHTMALVARAIEVRLATLQPDHRAYFVQRLATFTTSLARLQTVINQFRSTHPAVAAAVTEPVADYLLEAMGFTIKTPVAFQNDVMNGIDPAPQDISDQNALFTAREVEVLCYNQQVIDPLTISFQHSARTNDIPIVGVYETMPTPGYNYQSWMLAEVHALIAAVDDHVSTEHLS